MKETLQTYGPKVLFLIFHIFYLFAFVIILFLHFNENFCYTSFLFILLNTFLFLIYLHLCLFSVLFLSYYLFIFHVAISDVKRLIAINGIQNKSLFTRNICLCALHFNFDI